MNPSDWQDLIDQIRERESESASITHNSPSYRVEFVAGLTDAEVAAVESNFSFRFPPDLRDLLQVALPTGPGFPNWRSGDEQALREWFDLPREGITFDVEHNRFWLEEWGPRPASVQEALKMARELVAAAPRLIPIYSHRMMPAEPHMAGNPVFSVHQTDIIHYGFDLADYLRNEFGLPGREPWPEKVRPIRFWEIDRFQDVRWESGPVKFDNGRGVLP